jgi:hypothetical protein
VERESLVVADFSEEDWAPPKRPDIALPDNLPREVRRLVWSLQDVGCIRSPFIGHPDCFEVEGFARADMCPRCRALWPHRSSIER